MFLMARMTRCAVVGGHAEVGLFRHDNKVRKERLEGKHLYIGLEFLYEFDIVFGRSWITTWMIN